MKKNLALVARLEEIAKEKGCKSSQLALAWLLAQGEDIVPIPGTTRIEHLRENMGALEVHPAADVLARADGLINERTVSGARYNSAVQADIDTEEF